MRSEWFKAIGLIFVMLAVAFILAILLTTGAIDGAR